MNKQCKSLDEWMTEISIITGRKSDKEYYTSNYGAIGFIDYAKKKIGDNYYLIGIEKRKIYIILDPIILIDSKDGYPSLEQLTTVAKTLEEN